MVFLVSPRPIQWIKKNTVNTVNTVICGSSQKILFTFFLVQFHVRCWNDMKFVNDVVIGTIPLRPRVQPLGTAPVITQPQATAPPWGSPADPPPAKNIEYQRLLLTSIMFIFSCYLCLRGKKYFCHHKRPI
jgi:hypothetical protein